MNWRFSVGDKVYDESRNQNGVVVIRKYQEEPNGNFHLYHVCYHLQDGGVAYEWTEAEWLSLGHRYVD